MSSECDGILLQQWIVGRQVEPSRLDQKPVKTNYFKSCDAGSLPKISGL
jgi:hypothetical protein